ncbi:hypothetical protein J6590_100178 [Homalodisca vitripennis]|nr:hypothetical protein J6590_100178 [Homalodisca vitripennis]
MSSSETYSLDEILNLIESDCHVLSARVYINPPTNVNDSDEDSGEEDEVDLNRLTRHQLLPDAEARVTLVNENEITSEVISISEAVTNQAIAPPDNAARSPVNNPDCTPYANRSVTSVNQALESKKLPTKKKKPNERRWGKRIFLLFLRRNGKFLSGFTTMKKHPLSYLKCSMMTMS